MSAKRKSSKPAKVPQNTAQTTVTHHIAALLHTMRCITQFEDQLCVLAKAVKDAPSLDSALMRDIDELLTKVPAQEYTHDLEALREALAVATRNAAASPAQIS